MHPDELNTHTMELFVNKSANSFTTGRSNERKISSLFAPLLFADIRERVTIVDNEFNRSPVGTLQLTTELDVHSDCKQEEPPNDIFSEVECNPKPAPCAVITTAPVDGILISMNLVIVANSSSGTFTADMLLTADTNEIKTPLFV